MVLKIQQHQFLSFGGKHSLIFESLVNILAAVNCDSMTLYK